MSVNDPLEQAKMAAPGSEPSEDQRQSSRIDELESMDRDDVYGLAQELDVKGRSKMDKDELILAVVQAEAAKRSPKTEAQPPVPDPKPHTSPDAAPQSPQEAPEDETGEEADEEPEAPQSAEEASDEDEEVHVASSKDVPQARNPEWAVQNKVTVGWGGGRVLKLQPGVTISWSTHGKGCEVKLRNAGVRLSAVNDDAIDVDDEAEAEG